MACDVGGYRGPLKPHLHRYFFTFTLLDGPESQSMLESGIPRHTRVCGGNLSVYHGLLY